METLELLDYLFYFGCMMLSIGFAYVAFRPFDFVHWLFIFLISVIPFVNVIGASLGFLFSLGRLIEDKENAEK